MVVDLVLIMCFIIWASAKKMWVITNHQGLRVRQLWAVQVTVSWCRKPPPVFNDVLGVDKDGVLFCPFKHSAFSIQNVNIGTLERVTFALLGVFLPLTRSLLRQLFYVVLCIRGVVILLIPHRSPRISLCTRHENLNIHTFLHGFYRNYHFLSFKITVPVQREWHRRTQKHTPAKFEGDQLNN